MTLSILQRNRQDVIDRPEQFGELRGKAGIFGDNSERQQARRFARGLSNHVGATAQTWQRQKRDIVEIPGLTKQSEAILKTFDQLDHNQRQPLLEKMASTPEGRHALDEAQNITRALVHKFGTSEMLELENMDLRVGNKHIQHLKHITEVARLVEKASMADFNRKHELSLKMNKT